MFPVVAEKRAKESSDFLHNLRLSDTFSDSAGLDKDELDVGF